ncbi:importin subunit beta-like [Teleopsis dalmanni]|uniref:importin subunit beta-like n=1 Tax=Teleopsis dalmanni TaxID=139649 RepID=UPI0018CF221D|nr:importin subunit beta-like [Teleopsis dalmanni]
MEKYNVDVLAVQEVRWQGCGEIECNGTKFRFSGDAERSGRSGTGFLLNKRVEKSFLGFRPINDRICAYAPTEDADDIAKETYYTDLDETLSKTPSHDTKILLGDFNAKIGREQYNSNVAGLHSLHTVSSDNGKRLCQLATGSGMYISSTHFPHKNIHKGTWQLPGSTTVNQIDHVLIDHIKKSFILDVRSCRSANVDSDHFLVKATEQINICKDKDGELLVEKECIIKRWQEHFQELFNIGSESNNLSLTDLATSTEQEPEPTLEEFTEAIKQVKNGKSPGEDSISAELIKHCGESAKIELFTLIKRVWAEEMLPEAWLTGIVVPLHKKGDKLDYQIAQCLQSSLSTDIDELNASKDYLEQAAVTNLPEFIKFLSDILAGTHYPQLVRMAAGLQIKNYLTSKNENVLLLYQKRWYEFPEQTREYIKTNVLNALDMEITRPLCATQSVAVLAVLELQVNRWIEIIQTLANKVLEHRSKDIVREASLETIGYICQDLRCNILECQSNAILTSIVHGMRKYEPNNNIRLTATKALLNSLEFAKKNFDVESERNVIMEVVCEASQSADIDLCVSALQCIAHIATLYYHHMESYMADALFNITSEAVKSDIKEISLQGIEFWSSICDEELCLIMEQKQCDPRDCFPQNHLKHYARGAAQHLVPILIDKIIMQDEFINDENWSPPKAASLCLLLFARCCEDEILPYVIPFITSNIDALEWRYRNASIMLFAAILDGIQNNAREELIKYAIPKLIQLLSDKNCIVCDTTSWTFDRLCAVASETVIKDDHFQMLLQYFLKNLKSEPNIAAGVCGAIIGLAKGAYELANMEKNVFPETYCLSPFFENIVSQILETTQREDATSSNLRASAYDALINLISNSPIDCLHIVERVTTLILHRLNYFLGQAASTQNQGDRQQITDIQSLLCATLESGLRKLPYEIVEQLSDNIMVAVFTMFNLSTGRMDGTLEDGFLVISALVEIIDHVFLRYMDDFKPFLCDGLKRHNEGNLCSVTVGLTADICQALKHHILPYCDELMTALISLLHEPLLDCSITPQILSTIGDVAIAVGRDFLKYLNTVLDVLRSATCLQYQTNTVDVSDYVVDLRKSILEAYTSIIQALKGTDAQPNSDVHYLETHLVDIINFIKYIAAEEHCSDSLVTAIAGFVGDLCTAFGLKVNSLLDDFILTELLSNGRQSNVKNTKTMCLWSLNELKKLRTLQLSHQ